MLVSCTPSTSPALHLPLVVCHLATVAGLLKFTLKNYRDRTPGCVETTLRDLSWERLEERKEGSIGLSCCTRSTMGW